MKRNQCLKRVLVKIYLFGLVLSACTSGPAPLSTTEMPPTAPASLIATLPATSAPTPAPTPTAEPGCPEPTEGTQLLAREKLGYCLLYPAGYLEVDTDPAQVCLVAEGPTMACHSANTFIHVEDAAGRTASQIADALIAVHGPGLERSRLTIAGEEAVMLEPFYGQATSRKVFVVHADRLYMLEFIGPWGEDGNPELERSERFYATVIDSFAFVPATFPAPAPAEAGLGTGGSAVIAFVKDGDVVVWEETTGESQTIFDSGDAIRVELSGDGELVAFVRRSYFAAGGFDRNEQSSLWVMGRDGSNPRELISVPQLREQVNAAEADSTNFPRLAWIPNTHRLLFSGNTYDAHGYGEGAHTPLKGAYLMDADTTASTMIAPAEESLEFIPSPDGQQVALVSTTGLSFVDADGRNRRPDIFTYPPFGIPGPIIPSGVWTQDSSSFLISGPIERKSDILMNFTIWQVPADGTPPHPLINLDAGSPNVVFAPDGSTAAFSRWAPRGPDGGSEVSGWFAVPLPVGLGPVAVPADTLDRGFLTWSPGSSAYVLEARDREALLPLCPNAVQSGEICGPSVHFGEQIEWLEWLDRSRFLYVTYQPRRLYLGSLDGLATEIAREPESFSAVSSTCTDDSDYVSDVTIPDGTHLAPNTLFRKTWRVHNTGNCAWDASYRYTFLSGDRMSGPRGIPLGAVVQPGEEIDLSVTLIAPASAGTYQGQWQLFAPNGTPFGTRPYVVIQVP